MSRRLLLVPARFSSGLFVTKFSPAGRPVIGLTEADLVAARLEAREAPGNELKVAVHPAVGTPVKLLFQANPALPDNVGEATRMFGMR